MGNMKFKVYTSENDLEVVENVTSVSHDGNCVMFYEDQGYGDACFIASFTNYISCKRIKEETAKVEAVKPLPTPSRMSSWSFTDSERPMASTYGRSDW